MRETISNSSFPYPNKLFSPRKNHGAEICVYIFCANVPHSHLYIPCQNYVAKNIAPSAHFRRPLTANTTWNCTSSKPPPPSAAVRRTAGRTPPVSSSAGWTTFGQCRQPRKPTAVTNPGPGLGGAQPSAATSDRLRVRRSDTRDSPWTAIIRISQRQADNGPGKSDASIRCTGY